MNIPKYICSIIEMLTEPLCRPALHLKASAKRCRLSFGATMSFVSICFMLVMCGKNHAAVTPDERKTIDSIVHSTREIDSITLLQKRFEADGNMLGSIVAFREWGKLLRNESRFEEALRIHSEGLRLAEAVGDTLEWVQALNNIGTDYRRMGVLDVAQEYHYSAWMMSESFADTTFTAKKNRLVSLNGLGNIYLTLGNYERADSVLRMALKGEQELNSALGMAINYANLGSIFEYRGQTDSAWICYRRSMALNQEAGSDLGISLCHTYFGSLYEKARQYDKATEEYEAAYKIMQASKDEWHALNSLIALAGIHNVMGNGTKALDYLGKAKPVAERIGSKEHLAEIHTLYYEIFKRQGDYRTALASHEQAAVMKDSMLDLEKVNRIQNTSLRIERNRQERETDKMRLRLDQERVAKKNGIILFAIVVLFLLGLVVQLLYIQRIRKRNHLKLKRLSSLRETFFTNITHEFRTPLTVILGLSHDLQASDDAEVRDKGKTIERQGRGLLTLINQLLDISKIKSAVGNADWKNGNITAHLTMIIETYRDYARRRNIDLQFFSSEAVEMDFVPDYVNKVMNNLLSNAFKFTPEYGKVSVMMRREGKRVLIDVEDTGEGMDKETLSRVFEPFYQGETDARDLGTGVGLALVKQILDAVEGTITVESTVGRGTAFHISVPIRNEARPQISELTETNTPLLPETETTLADGPGDDNLCRLLVIEDNRDIAAYIGTQFAGCYAVSYAANGLEGLEKAQELVPDLIVTDLMMPAMDGLEVCRRIRSNEIIDHIPIIVVTAKVAEEERVKGLEAGADAYIAKPFNADELRTRVEKLLEGRRLLREKYAQMMVTNQDREEDESMQKDTAAIRFLAKVSDYIYLQLNRGKVIEVSQVASAMCMSDRQFYRKMNALTNSTPTVYIQRIKIKKARSLLDANPQMSFGEIADRCGFNDYSNFVRTFKNAYGVTPTDYRRGNAGKG